MGKWWEGYDPQELYAQNHERSRNWQNVSSMWDWNNGASLPSEEYKQKFQNRVLELINDYDPQMIYFDDTAMPFYGCDDKIGQNILAHYYNTSAAANGGTPNVVVTGKQLDSDQKDYMMWDVERGIPDRMQKEYWQTCTCIGSWHYDQNVYKNGWYKSGATVIRMLVDVVSKNGNLLLSVPVKSDGTIDDKEEAILADIKAWLDVNSESIYGTRTWKTFGEGPLADAANPMNAQGFNEGQNYSSKDVRYVQKDGTIYATVMAWPSAGRFSFKSFSLASDYYSGKVKSVKLLGYDGNIEFSQGIEGLTVMVPATHPNDIAPVFAITVEEVEQSAWEALQEAIESLEAYIATMRVEASYINTGKLSTLYLPTIQEAVAEAKKVKADASDEEIAKAEKALLDAYNDFLANGTNKGGKFEGEYERDVTADYLVEAENFTRQGGGNDRFGDPLYWTVENFNIPQSNNDGTKAGLDKYSGKEALYLGLWDDRGNNTEGDLTDARIYCKVTLPAGTYYFGAGYNTHYNLSANAYMFVSTALCGTAEIPQRSIAYYPIVEATEDKQLCGLWFKLEEEQEVYIGFQADLQNGSGQQEFRAEKVALYKLSDVNEYTLEDFLYGMDAQLAEMEEHVSDNTGFYSKAAWQEMRAVCDEWMDKLGDLSGVDVSKVYFELSEQWTDFLKNKKNQGGAPLATGYEDLTIEVLKEADHFARTAETDDGDRFGAPKYWTVENFGFGDQAGIDGIKGYDCLHLEVWWNGNAYPENGYDISNVRLYQLADLKAGMYYFGASYPSAEANDELYIFASDQLLNTDEISTQSIAYEKVNLAPADGSFRGIFFTLEEDAQVYLGWQTDFTNCVTNNLRASGVKLLYYGTMSYSKLEAGIADIEQELKTVKVNENTGFYAPEALEELKAAIGEAKKVSADAAMDEVSKAYNALNEAYADFLQNGKNKGGILEDEDVTDLTVEKLGEADRFTREDESVTDRFAAPKYWTVENYDIPSSWEGVRGGLDNYPGKDCLTIGVWDDKGNAPAESDISNTRVYKKVSLDAGRYFFGNTYNANYNLSEAYIFAVGETLATSDIQKDAIAWMKIAECGNQDGNYWGIWFTLDEPQEVLLGWQVDLLNGANTQEFRAEKVKLVKYDAGTPVGIVETAAQEDANAPVEIYTLQGIRLNAVPQSGFYVVKQGSKVMKYLKR